MKASKYFAVILDCATCISKTGQLSLTVKYVFDGSTVPVRMWAFYWFHWCEGKYGKESPSCTAFKFTRYQVSRLWQCYLYMKGSKLVFRPSSRNKPKSSRFILCVSLAICCWETFQRRVRREWHYLVSFKKCMPSAFDSKMGSFYEES